jgi:hypothetical protein
VSDENTKVRVFTITYFGLSALEGDVLMNLYADHAYQFTKRHGLEAPSVSSVGYGSVAKWEEEPKEEECWVGDSDSTPMPTGIMTHEGAFHEDGVTPLVVNDERMRAAGWKKMRRQVTEWEEVDD